MKLLFTTILLTIVFISCKKEDGAIKEEENIEEYFSVKIDNVLWEAEADTKYGNPYNIRYNAAKNLLSIQGENKQGLGTSFMRLAIQINNDGILTPGNYASILGAGSDLIGVCCDNKNASLLYSIDISVPVPKEREENTIQITRIDRSNPKAYIIEGTFASKVFALTLPATSNLTDGKFRVVYRPDANNPAL